MYLSLSIHQVRGICLLPYSEFTCVSKFLFLKLVWVRFLSLWPKLSWYCIRESHYPTLKLFIYKMVILSVNLDSKLVERKRQYYLTYRGVLKYSRSQDGWLGGSSLDAGTPMSSLCGAQGSVLRASSSAQSKTVRCFHLHQVPRKFCPRAQETSLRSPAQQTSPHSSLARLGSHAHSGVSWRWEPSPWLGSGLSFPWGKWLSGDGTGIWGKEQQKKDAGPGPRCLLQKITRAAWPRGLDYSLVAM